MCGLISLISPRKVNGVSDRRKLLNDMIVHDTIRGVHSTGMYWVGHDDKNKVWWHKKDIPGWDFQNDPVYSRYLRDLDDYRFVVGHNRAATQGKVNTENAHPFVYGNIIGVHNGTIWNKGQLPDGNKFQVDSQAIINSIDVQGEKETLKQLDGAFALIWYDLGEGALKIVRNSERTLGMMYDKQKETIAIASETDMLDWLFSRNKFFSQYALEFEAGHLYTFPFDDPLHYEKEKVEFRKKTYPVTSQGGHSNRNFPPPVPQQSPNQGANKKLYSNSCGAEARAKRLERNGFAHGESVLAMVVDFWKYSEDSNFVCLEAESYDQEGIPVILHGVYESMVNKNDLLGCTIRCEVFGAGQWGTVDDGQERILIYAKPEFTIADDETTNVTPIREGRKEKEIIDVPFDDDLGTEDTAFDPDDPRSYVKEDEGWTKDSLFQGPRGLLIPKYEFEAYTDSGCIFCNDNIFPGDHYDISWTQSGDPLCPRCTKDMDQSGIESSQIH